MDTLQLPKDTIGPVAFIKEWIAGLALRLFLNWTTPYQFNAVMELFKSPLRMPE